MLGVDHYYIGKALMQLNDRTNKIVRQQTGRTALLGRSPRHRRQNKFGKLW